VGSLYDLPWLYDALCPPLEPGDPELAWWLDVCAGATTVLELGAGTGRLAVPLARAGLAVTALEPSAAMRAAGQDKARAAHVAVRWIDGDMRDMRDMRDMHDMRASIDDPVADPPARFDRIVVAFNTFLHLHTRDDHRRFFASARRCLTPCGRLALSVVSPDPETLGRRPGHRLRMHAHEIVDARTGVRLTIDETVRWDHAAQCTRGHLHVSEPSRRDVLVVPLDLRMVFPQELALLLEHEGFDVHVLHGDFEGRAFGGASRWQNVVCAPR